MEQPTWKQSGDLEPAAASKTWLLWLIAAVLIAATGWLVWNSIASGGTQLYKTVDEFVAEQDRLVGNQLRLAGWVDASTISYQQIDETHSRLEFDITSGEDGSGERVHIVVLDEPKPDLLQKGAQALVDGEAISGQELIANPGGLLLKCPTRYEPESAGADA